MFAGSELHGNAGYGFCRKSIDIRHLVSRGDCARGVCRKPVSTINVELLRAYRVSDGIEEIEPG